MISKYVVAFFIGAMIVALGWTIKTNFASRMQVRALETKVDQYILVIGELCKTQDQLLSAFNKIAEKSITFEATSYTAKPLDDGRIEVTFFRDIGPTEPENPENKNKTSEVRTVILPAYLWSNVTAEVALKLGFESLYKAKRKEAEK